MSRIRAVGSSSRHPARVVALAISDVPGDVPWTRRADRGRPCAFVLARYGVLLQRYAALERGSGDP
jgi:hypothetical protein